MRNMLIAAAMLAAIPGAVLADDGSTGGGAPPPVSAPAPDSTPPPAAAPVLNRPAARPGSDQPHFGFSVAGAFEFGGDDLATVYFTDGSSENLYAGQGLLLSVGGNYRPTRYSPWDVSLLAGYKINEAGGSNGDISFNHIPIELIGSYRWPNRIFMGVGPVYHTGVQFKGSGALGSAPNVNFKDAVGGEIQAGWSWVALTYTFINYEDDYGDKFNGDNFGVRFFYNF